jgi:hypothetical protein
MQREQFMHISFIANNVTYNEAIDGEIVQALFEENSETELDDPFDASKLYLLVSINYEISPFSPEIEWSDGHEFSGGAKVLNFMLNRESFQVWLDNGMSFDIQHKADQKTFKQIQHFLSRVFKEQDRA